MPAFLTRTYELIGTGQRRFINFLSGQMFRRMEGNLKGEAKEARAAAERAEEASKETREMMFRMHDAQQAFMLSVYKEQIDPDNLGR